MAKVEGPPHHDRAPAEGHPLLDSVILVSFPRPPPYSHPAVRVVQIESRFVTEEHLSPMLASPPLVAATEGKPSPPMCSCQAWTNSWATSMETNTTKTVSDGLLADVSVSSRTQLLSDNVCRDVSLLQSLPFNEPVLSWCCLLWSTRPRPLLDAVSGPVTLVQPHNDGVRDM